MNRSILLRILIGRARKSNFWLRILSSLMARTIPFNKPHRFRIDALAKDRIRIFGPYRKSNFNHIRGIHACAIATAAEYAAGFLLLINLDPKKYRIIMAKLSAEYHYQAKEDIIAEARLDGGRLQNEVQEPLDGGDSATIDMQTIVRDISENRVAVVTTTWQVKRWDRVRTKR